MKTPTKVAEGYYVTTEEYAAVAKVSPATVKRRCMDGSLQATKVGRAWLIPVGAGWGR